MRLGVVMRGVGVYAACAAGVMQELSRRKIEPYAVCGLQTGAWPAALYAAGRDDLSSCVDQAAKVGHKLLSPCMSSGAVVRGRACAMARGRRLEQLLIAQMGHRILSLCPRTAVFPCRTTQPQRRMILSTKLYEQDRDAILAVQATASFAVRAAMALPPFLSPVRFMGASLLADGDTAFACRQLFALGAQRVLVVSPVSLPGSEWDALDYAASALGWQDELPPMDHVGVLHVETPRNVSALHVSKAPVCMQAGRRAAEAELDRIFAQMGMAFCRVLPFTRTM